METLAFILICAWLEFVEVRKKYGIEKWVIRNFWNVGESDTFVDQFIGREDEGGNAESI